MRPIILDMKDMSDSTEVYESRPNPFFIYFIYVLLALFVAAFIWMYFFQIDIVVKSNGMFRCEASGVSVSSNANGVVTACNISEGQYVQEGELLFTLEAESLENSLAEQKALLEDVEERILILKAYENYLDGEENALESCCGNKYYEEFSNRKQLLGLNAKMAKTYDTKELNLLSEKQSVAAELTSYETKRMEYEAIIKQYELESENTKVTAASSGYICLTQELSVGSYVTQGSSVCQILPEGSCGYYAEIYVENFDIAKIQEGQEVKFEIAAYPSSEYGYFTGVVDSISKDIKVDQNSGSAYYLVKVRCEQTTVTNKDGETGCLMNGMACQAKVVVDDKNVLSYLLEKLDLLD